MIIKTVKLTKQVPIDVTCITTVPGTNEIDYIQPYSFTVKWKLSARGEEYDDDINELAVSQNVSMHKIEHFVTNYLNHAIWFDETGIGMANAVLPSTENLLLITPDANFTCLGLCLYAKLNSLCSNSIVVTELYLEDTRINQSFEYSDLDGEMPIQLPTQLEFMGENSIWESPWWERDDLFTYDSRVENSEDLAETRENVQKAIARIQDDFQIIEDQVRGMLNPQEGEEAEVIEVDFSKLTSKEEWKPKLV